MHLLLKNGVNKILRLLRQGREKITKSSNFMTYVNPPFLNTPNSSIWLIILLIPVLSCLISTSYETDGKHTGKYSISFLQQMLIFFDFFFFFFWGGAIILIQ